MDEYTVEKDGVTVEKDRTEETLPSVASDVTVSAGKKKKKSDKKSSKKSRDDGLTEEEKKLREEQRKRAARKKRKKIIKTLIIIFIIFAVLAFAVWKFWQIKQNEKEAANLTVYTVARRTITEKLSATGTLQPADSYTVTSKVRGDIINCFFEEGDEVTKDDILYVIDSDDMDSTLRQREMSVEKAQNNLKDLKEKRNELKATSDLNGTVVKLYVEEGDTVQKGGVIADIIDNENMLIDIPFHAAHADAMSVGTYVNLTIDGTGEVLTGTVTEISAVTAMSAYNAPTKTVTVRVSNPGGIFKNTRALGDCGEDIVSTDFGTFYYNVEEQLKAEYGGEIKSISIKEGSKIYTGQTIIVFDDEDLEDQIKDAEDSLETAQMNYDDTIENLGDYEIKAPITGTVVEKNFNVGESIDVTSGNATVAIIYDLSALTFEMSIDELDIFSVEKGQEVSVTSDAISEVFYGEITKISKVGSTSGGTTVYPVTVTITDEAALKKLLPGMNIDAEITVKRVENVIAVPTGAVARGNTVKVVKNPDAVREWQGNKNAGVQAKTGEKMPEGMPEMPADGVMPEGAPVKPAEGIALDGTVFPEGRPEMSDKGKMPEISAEAADGNVSVDESVIPEGNTIPEAVHGDTSDDSTAPAQGKNYGQNRQNDFRMPAVYGNAPSDTEYEIRKVETGISDDDFIEIISGLEEGDMVIIEQNQTQSSGFGMMGGMPGGMGGMGMPGGMGGMSGGMGGMPAGNRQNGGMSGGAGNRMPGNR